MYERAPVPLRRTPGAARAQPRRHQHGGSAHAAEWRAILGTLIERNGGGDQYVYWQVTRGAEYGRNHAPLPRHPAHRVRLSARRCRRTRPSVLEKGVACVTAADTRWARCDIKSIALLANVLLRQLAVDAGAAETILLREGELMEASASAVHVVHRRRGADAAELAPHPARHHALRRSRRWPRVPLSAAASCR